MRMRIRIYEFEQQQVIRFEIIKSIVVRMKIGITGVPIYEFKVRQLTK